MRYITIIILTMILGYVVIQLSNTQILSVSNTETRDTIVRKPPVFLNTEHVAVLTTVTDSICNPVEYTSDNVIATPFGEFKYSENKVTVLICWTVNYYYDLKAYEYDNNNLYLYGKIEAHHSHKIYNGTTELGWGSQANLNFDYFNEYAESQYKHNIRSENVFEAMGRTGIILEQLTGRKVIFSTNATDLLHVK